MPALPEIGRLVLGEWGAADDPDASVAYCRREESSWQHITPRDGWTDCAPPDRWCHMPEWTELRPPPTATSKRASKAKRETVVAELKYVNPAFHAEVAKESLERQSRLDAIAAILETTKHGPVTQGRDIYALAIGSPKRSVAAALKRWSKK